MEWSEISVMANFTEIVLFMGRIWKQGWQLYQRAELEGEFYNLASISKSSAVVASTRSILAGY